MPLRNHLLLSLLLLLAACQSDPEPAPTRAVSAPPPLPAFTAVSTRSVTPTRPPPAPSATAVPTHTPAASPTSIFPDPLPEPAGCLAPPEEAGEVVEVNGWALNQRTLAMLAYAEQLYGGPIDLNEDAVTQGSYHDNGAASFGTHLGGGAVDLSIFLPGTWTVDFAGLPRLVRALRTAGFAAWVRRIDEVYPGSGYHIHAVAVGDPQLSEAAEAQLTGLFGYFRGYNGLPQESGVPIPDREGGPILCRWMLDLGYADLRADPSQLGETDVPADWFTRLDATAVDLRAASSAETAALASRLYTTPEHLDRALAWALWDAAGLLPPAPNPAARLGSWLTTAGEEAFWSWFSPDFYSHQTFTPPLPDAEAFLPGDLLYLTPAVPGNDLFLVVDAAGTVLTARRGEDGAWRVQPEPPDDLLAGDWAAIDRLRRTGLAWTAAQPFQAAVLPGDTLQSITARYHLPLAALQPPVPSVLTPGNSLTLLP